MSPPASARAARLWGRLGRLAYGADYNPEQWDEATWAEDAKLMVEAGVNLVSLGIFGWAVLEPRPGRYDFRWLDRVMDLLAGAGVSVCLATATASPPPWLTTAHPEVLPIDADGRRLWHGSRQHFCPSSPVFRASAARLVERLADRYAGHPALAAWHVGNEYGCHVARCYCDVSAADFRAWLRRRYADLDGLNRAWSTSFWSQRYAEWDEVLPPRATPTFPNPAQQLDFFRFSSAALLACFEHEAAILRRVTPDVPVTTNFLGIWNLVDGFDWAGHEDIVSHDSYPDPRDPDAAVGAAMVFDFIRGAAGGQPWLLLEQAPSAVNWRACNQPKPPGVYRLWSWQAIAHGANGALSFQWRASRGGAEKFHSAMVPHGGTAGPVFREVAELGRELAAVPSLAGTAPAPAEVAIVMDWSSWWALELPSRPSTRLHLMELLRAYYEPLWRAGVPVEFAHPSAELSRYRLVLVPNLYLVEDSWARGLDRFVADGGELVVGFFSGIVDATDTVWPGGYPGALRGLLGVEIDRFWPLDTGERVGIRLGSETTGTGTLWSEELRATDAEVIGWFAGGPLDGQPALTRARRGQGRAWYLGTLPDPQTLAGLLADARDSARVQGVLPRLPSGVEATRRTGAGRDVLFLLNHGSEPAAVQVPDGYAALAGVRPDGGLVTLRPRDVAVLQRP